VLRLKVKLREGDVIKVVWLDAYTAGDGWIDPDELKDRWKGVYRITSVGIYQSTDSGYIRMVQSTGDGGDKFDGGMVGGFSVPIGCIEKVTIMKESHTRSKR
jgi:hypothetical protein